MTNLITTAEAARRLGVDRSQVSRYIRAGLIPAIRITSRFNLINPADLVGFQRPKPTGRPPKSHG